MKTEENDQARMDSSINRVSTDEATAPSVAPIAHAPLPWHQGPYYKTDIESRGGRVAECRPFTQRGAGDAEFIVRAANSHYQMLAVLKLLWLDAQESAWWSPEYSARVEAAIAKAEGR